MVVEFGDGETLVSSTRFGIAVLIGKPEITTARIELCIDVLVSEVDGNTVGELAVGKAST